MKKQLLKRSWSEVWSTLAFDAKWAIYSYCTLALLLVLLGTTSASKRPSLIDDQLARRSTTALHDSFRGTLDPSPLARTLDVL